jgi:hypothetical protein
MANGNQVGRHWSKDFVEHLRSVHFALIAVSVGVILLACTRSQSEVSRAYEQIRHIVDLTDGAHWDSNFLEHSALTTDELTESVSGATVTIEIPGSGVQHLNIILKSRGFVVLNKDQSDPYYDGPKLDGDSKLSTVLPQPDSLAKFQRLWNLLDGGATVKKVAALPTRCLVAYYSDEKGFREGSCALVAASPIANPDDVFVLRRVTDSGRKDLNKREIKPFDYFYHGRGLRKFAIRFPVDSFTEKAFDAEEIAVINKHPDWHWHSGSFESAFRELYNISKDYLDSAQTTVEKIVAGEEKRSGESLDAFGIKFPAETAIQWGAGAVIILAVQLYLWAHLFEFRRKLGSADEGWDVAWMGVYESRPSRGLLYSSLVILPLAGIIAVGIRGLYISEFRWYSKVILAVTSVATLLLSVLISNALPRRKELIAEEQKPSRESENATT